MKSLLLISLAMAIVGYFVGSAGRNLQAQDSGTKNESDSSANQRGRSGLTVVPSTIKSADTVAILSKLPAPELYDRLALWLLDASPSDMQEFWSEYTLRDDHTNDLNDLVFINWTRIDPEAAIAASTGTDFAHYPWWAWACHEPQKALKEVLARYEGKKNQDRIGEVMWGIGEFHPEWLREHIDELPEKWMRDRALMGYTKWADTENPRESIEFLKERGWSIDKKTLTAFALESPLEAYQIALDLQSDRSNYGASQLPDQLIDSLAKQDPALLDEILANTNSPVGKMKIQIKQFEEVLKSDPEAAEKKIEKMPDSWIKQDLLAAMGNHYLKTDPLKAVEFAAQIFQSKEDPTSRYTYTFRESGRSGYGNSNQEVLQLRDELVRSHPEEFINALVPTDEESSGQYLSIASSWASQDLPAFAEWVTGQDHPDVYKSSARLVVSGLANKAHYEEAMDWAQSIASKSEDKRRHSYEISGTYEKWFKADPDAAINWKENASLNEQNLELLQHIEKEQQSR